MQTYDEFKQFVLNTIQEIEKLKKELKSLLNLDL